MSSPRHDCCAFPVWDRIDDDGTMWVCGSCGCVWDEYGGVIEDGNNGFQIEGEE